jgi:hypothetical protein
MSQETLTQKLAKANVDISKLCAFFAARPEWLLATDAGQPALQLSAAAGAFHDHLKTLLDESGVDRADPYHPKVSSVGSGAHERTRLLRFAAFLRDLDAWLAAQTEPTGEPEAIVELRTMESKLSCLVAAADAVAGAQVEPASEEFAGNDDVAIEPAELGGEPVGTVAAGPEGAPLQLVLDDADERPMVQTFQDTDELTQDCERLVEEFLVSWGIDYNYADLLKLRQRVLRWITSAPEGQVLVLKMKTLEEPVEPYPSYVSREILAGGAEPPDEAP